MGISRWQCAARCFMSFPMGHSSKIGLSEYSCPADRTSLGLRRPFFPRCPLNLRVKGGSEAQNDPTDRAKPLPEVETA
jgi:hypothetical protein